MPFTTTLPSPGLEPPTSCIEISGAAWHMTPEPLPSLHSVLLEYSQSSRDSSAPVQRTQPRNDVLGTGPNTESQHTTHHCCLLLTPIKDTYRRTIHIHITLGA